MTTLSCLRVLPVLLVAAAAAPDAAWAQTAPPEDASTLPHELEDESLPLEFHGFVSQGFIKSTGNNYLAGSKRGSFELTEVGINLTKALDDRLRIGVQLFARDLGPLGNYDARFDWFYLDYRLSDWLGVRAGRTKLPYGLYNEISDIDSARVPVLLPQSIYPVRNRDYLLAQTGVELYGFAELGPLGGLEYRLYGGTILLDPPNNPESPFRVLRQDVPYLVGGRLLWETPLYGLRAGGSVQALRVDYDFNGPGVITPTTPGAPGGIAQAQIPALLWVASVEYVGTAVQLAAEYGRWHVDLESSVPTVVPSSSTISERLFVLGAYRVNRWLTPGLYYSLFFPDKTKREGRQNYQHDVAATLRFDLTTHWLLKLETHYMRGTADLTTALNDRRPLSDLEKNWLVFLLKSTVFF